MSLYESSSNKSILWFSLQQFEKEFIFELLLIMIRIYNRLRAKQSVRFHFANSLVFHALFAAAIIINKDKNEPTSHAHGQRNAGRIFSFVGV